MSHCQNLQAILAELMADAQQIDGEEVNALGEAIMQAKRVFVAGPGVPVLQQGHSQIDLCTGF